MTMREENLHAGGKWETMNFLGVALYIDLRFVLSHYKEFLRIVVPILNKDRVRICSIGTL